MTHHDAGSGPDTPDQPGPASPAAPREGGGEAVVDLDGRGLRALAHPVRMRLLGLLRRDGPSTATRLADQLGLASGATSYHLRRLAEAGLVAEDAERGNRRDRWWRAVHRMTRYDAVDMWADDPDGAQLFVQSVAMQYTERMQRYGTEYGTWPQRWRHAGALGDRMLCLTPEESARLAAELGEVLGRYRQAAAAERDGAPEGAEPVFAQFAVLPEPAEEDGDGESAGDAGARVGPGDGESSRRGGAQP